MRKNPENKNHQCPLYSVEVFFLKYSVEVFKKFKYFIEVMQKNVQDFHVHYCKLLSKK
jgi:hypothetical protein